MTKSTKQDPQLLPPDSEQPCADYEVGYGKPPAHTKFKKGQSGNPRGRPKRVKSTAAVALAVLNEKIVVTENNKRKLITKREAVIKHVVNRSLQGDPASTRLVVTQILPAVDAAQNNVALSRAVDIDDELILAPLLDQLQSAPSSTLTLEPAQSPTPSEPRQDDENAADDGKESS